MIPCHLVSVLVPCYNHENYVQNTICSIVEQTYENIELLVIDDGSTDNSFNKILEMKELYSNRFRRFVALKQNNKGLIHVLNELIRMSRGDYISLVASDDVLEVDAISSEITVLNSNPHIMLVAGKNDIIDSHGNVCYWDEQRNNVYEKSKAKWLTFSDYISDTLKINFKGKEFGRYDKLLECNHVPNGYLIRKSVFDLIGYYTHQAPLEDWWLMLQVSKYGELGFIDKTVLKYRWHGANQMNNIERIMQIEQRTRLYEYQLLANISDEGKLNSFNKFRHDYIHKALIQCDVIKKELHCKKAHVELLITHERELQSKVNCQKGHIELLLQSERELQSKVNCQEGHIELLLQSERELQSKVNCQEGHIELLLQRERELQSKVNCQESHIELLLQSERDLKRLSDELKNENDIYVHTLNQYKIMKECVENLRQSILFKFCSLFNNKFKDLCKFVFSSLK